MGLVFAAVVATAGSAPVSAQNKDLSDRSVQVLMDHAWAYTPPKYTPPDGKTVEIDKTKRKEAMIPFDVAREVIKVGRLSAHAQACDLIEEQRSNYRTLMLREQAKSTWSDQQLVFISQLHMTTVGFLTGKLVVVEKEGEKVVSERELKKGRVQSCTDIERQQIKTQIIAYVNASPAPAPAAKTAEPAKTAPQKK